jgi:thiamine pyrophosphokinase
MKSAVIIAYIENTDLSSRLRHQAEEAIAAGALLICADRGGMTALRWGLQPDWVVGDLDSLEPEALATLQAMPEVAWRTAPAEKDETDLELALYTALEVGARDLIILGGLGGRLDHTLGNLYLLAAPRLTEVGAQVCLLGENEEIFLLRGGDALHLEGNPGELVSLIPLSSAAQGIRTEGLYYPLRSETLWLGPSRGVSNEFTGQSATVTFDAGLLLVIHTFSAD